MEFEWIPTAAIVEKMDVIGEAFQGFWIGPGFPDLGEVMVKTTSKAYAFYQSDRVIEAFRCGFGLHPNYQMQIHEAGLEVVGTDTAGNARIVELPWHPFYIGTLFVPRLTSTSESPHRIVDAFVAAAWNRPREQMNNREAPSNRSLSARLRRNRRTNT